MSIESSQDEKKFEQVRVGPRTYTIPKEWEITQVGEIANVEYGKSLPEADGEIPAIGSSGSYDTVGNSLIQQDTIVIGRKGSAGEAYLVKGGCWPSDTTFYLTDLDSDLVDMEFLHYYMSHNSLAEEIEQTTLPSLDRNRLETYRVLTPSLPEQRRIAEILSTVDKQIQQTDNIISTLRELRKGLLQDMYRSGLNNDSLVDHPTIGAYPESWSIAELSAVAEVTMGSSPKSEYYNNEGNGLPFFQGCADFGERTPTVTTWCSKPNKTASRGDVLMSVRAPVGDLNIAVEECCIGRGLAAISPTDIDPSYLYWMLEVRKEYLASIASGSTFESINSSELRTLDILVPKTQEQEAIREVLESVTKSYKKEQEHKQLLHELKRGLMQDLLTGKVRVDTD